MLGFQVGILFEAHIASPPLGETGEGFVACYNLIHAKEEEIPHSPQAHC